MSALGLPTDGSPDTDRLRPSITDLVAATANHSDDRHSPYDDHCGHDSPYDDRRARVDGDSY